MLGTLRSATILFFCSASICLASGAADSVNTFVGLTVSEISQEGSDMADGEFRALVPFEVGDVLEMSRVRNGILNLFRTGLYRRVEVRGRPHDGGVAVLFRLTPKRWLNEVIFQGNLRLSDGDLSRKVDLGREDELTPADLERNRERLVDYYRYRGFMEPQISYLTEVAPKNRTDVIYSIAEGLRWQISEVSMSGDSGMSRGKLMATIASMPGTQLDGEDLDRDLTRITEHLKEKGYYYPRVSYTVEKDPRFRGDAVVEFLIEKGTLYRLGVESPSGLESIGRFRRWMRSSFLVEPDPDRAMERSGTRVKEYFLGTGYPFVSVEWEDRSPEAGERELVLKISRGDLAVIGTVTIEGIQSLTDQEVARALQMNTGDPFVHASLDRGLQLLDEAYMTKGYQSAKIIQKPLNFVPVDGRQEVMIHIVVEEGIRTIVNGVRVQSDVYGRDEIIDILNIHPGDPHVPSRVEEGRLSLIERLSGDGYLFGSIPLPEVVRIEEGKVDLVFDIRAGPKVRLGSIIILGGEEVDNTIVRRAVNMERGHLLSLEEILEAQRRVYALGVHSSVEISLVDPEIAAEVKDLVVKVRERPRYAIGIRLGYGSEEKGRVRFTVTDRNFAHMARSLILGFRFSDIEELASLTYLHPWFLGEPIEFSISLIDLIEERESYTRDELGVVLSAKTDLTRRTTLRLQYAFEGLELTDVSPDAQLSPEDEGRTDVASLIPELLYDSRDDFFEPSSGILGDIRLEVAMEQLGSKAEFHKLEISIRKYFSLGGGFVLAGLARGGIAESFGISDEVIISERFFLGGQNSVRGYDLDSLGPLDADGDPIGGIKMVNLNLELRYPIYRSIKGVLFADSGALWLDQAPYDDRTLRLAAGTGLRWSSPIGPLSLDYGRKLNPATDEEDQWRVHFSIGHAF
ncbi:MAG: BamA/TamA family outer membrane protein [bacterium]|nr:MAG: BamA/TamA family outer membrane protein [bacterium]